jgi:hypothetical protein
MSSAWQEYTRIPLRRCTPSPPRTILPVSAFLMMNGYGICLRRFSRTILSRRGMLNNNSVKEAQSVELVRVYYAGEFPAREREYVAVMRMLAEHAAAADVGGGLEAVPFNCLGFGLFPPGRAADPESPCLCLWCDDPSPLYWLQLRRRWNRDILTCDQLASPEEVWASAAEAVPRLLAEAEQSPASGTRVPLEWLRQISPITNFVNKH